MGQPAARYLDAGEMALVVEFGEAVDPAVHDRVLALDQALARRALPGVVECVPTFRSLMIHYDPLRLERAALVAAIEGLDPAGETGAAEVATWTLPCCYAPPHGEDLGEVAAALGSTPERVAEVHAGATYRAYMYGFAPGHLYLGAVPGEIAISRRPAPRLPHAAGAVLLGGGMTLASSLAMPTGWYVIGRIPDRLFALDREPAAFIRVGDLVRFAPVGSDAFAGLEARVAAGEIVARREDRP